MKLKNAQQNIATRCYTEKALRELPLRVRANDYGIERATAALLANSDYLVLIPKRQNPHISGQEASQFSNGNCVPYAEAVQELTGLPAVGIEVLRYADECGSRLGFCHAVVLHPDGNVEDSWGIQPLSVILERFFIKEYQMSEQIFLDAKERQICEYAEKYKNAYDKAFGMCRRINPSEN